MNSRKKKWLYAVVISCSIAICLFGIQTSMRQKQQKKVTYAKLAMKQEAEKIKNFSASLDSFYKQDRPDFLIDTLELSSISEMEQQVRLLKVTVSDYDLTQGDFSENQELERDKKKLLDKIEEVKMKQTILQSVTSLVNHLPVDWSANLEGIVVKEETTLADIHLLQQSVVNQTSLWHQAVAAVLATMELQIIHYENVKAQIDEMLVDDHLTDKATNDAWLLSYNQLTFIKNEQLHAQLAEKLAIIEAQLLGYQTAADETPAPNEAGEAYDE